jgi:hypothetical protein
LAKASVGQSNDLLAHPQKLDKARLTGVIIGEGIIYLATMIGLSQAWYKQTSHSRFHLFNDNTEWLQMDKFGHAFTCYTIGRGGMELLKWSGVPEKQSLLYGSTLGLAFMSAIEIMDGFQDSYGFSMGDMAANTAGFALLAGQEMAWKEQRVVMLFSFHPTQYAAMRPEMLGNTFFKNIVKDYNGQTYWLSTNIHSFINGRTFVPTWLNATVGIGADGMLSGHPMKANDSMATQFQRHRKYFISLDTDLSRFKIEPENYKFLMIPSSWMKVPAPALEYQNSRFAFKPIYF